METKIIAGELKGLRAKKGYSRDYVSNIINITRDTLARHEKDANNLKTETLFKLLKIYSVDPIIFFKNIYDNSHTKEVK